jgi:hypothetical protein
MTMAERELSAFFNAVAQLFGSEQAELSAENWLLELIEIDGLPASTREWRLITAKASTRLASRVSASSRSLSLSTSYRLKHNLLRRKRRICVFLLPALQASLVRQLSEN